MLNGLGKWCRESMGKVAADDGKVFCFGNRKVFMPDFIGEPGFARIKGVIVDLKGRTVAEVLQSQEALKRVDLL